MNTLTRISVAAALAAVVAAPLQAQDHAVAGEVYFQGYSFEDGFSTESINLFLTPLAYRLPIGTAMLDFYGAWGKGQVEVSGQTFELSGLVDSRVKLTIPASPWALFTISANLPTGNASHTDEEAVVAGVLSSDLLGFRESVWGNGFSVTSGISAGTQVDEWGLGLGVSYRLAQEFEPEENSNLKYEPGNEIRIRAGIDRNVGETGKLSIGATFQNFQEDAADGRNLFQAGNRIMGDVALGFRVGRQVWNFYAVDLWRESGDLSLQIVDAQSNQVVGDTTVTTASQNLLTLGAAGGISLGDVQTLRTNFDVRIQSRDTPGGGDEGSGWIAGAGVELPISLGGRGTLLPSGRFLFGSVKDGVGEDRSLTGVEAGLILRLEIGR